LVQETRHNKKRHTPGRAITAERTQSAHSNAPAMAAVATDARDPLDDVADRVGSLDSVDKIGSLDESAFSATGVSPSGVPASVPSRRGSIDLNQTMLASMLPDLDARVVAELVRSGRSASVASQDQPWEHSPPALTGGELDFLSRTPPVAGSIEEKASTARRRTAGPRHGTFERQHGSDWGGRQPELSSSMEALRMAAPRPPRPPRGGRHAVRRLRSVATLRQQNAVDEAQASAIKDLLVLGDHDELHAALDRYVESSMTDSTELVELAKRGGLEVTRASSSMGTSEASARLRTDSVASVGLEFEHLMDLDAGLSGVPVVFDGPSPRHRAASTGSASDGLGPAFAMDFEDPQGPLFGGNYDDPDFGSENAQPLRRRAAARRRAPPIERQEAYARPANGSSPVAGAISSTIQMSDVPPLDRILRGEAPTYDALVNYPRAKARGARHCVMCGRQPSADAGRTAPVARPPPPSRGHPPVTVVVDGRAQRTPSKSLPGLDPETPATVDRPPPPIRRGGAVIPKQNKDVCRECDKATWVHASTGCYFKWCKGCKRFRNLRGFAGKLAASKCDGCRARGREGYMRRKEGGETTEAAPAPAPSTSRPRGPGRGQPPAPVTVVVRPEA
jgi:hypothetical protein